MDDAQNEAFGIEPKVAYEQLCNDFRALNAILWQAPVFFTTLTGGLWFVAASFDLAPDAQIWILRFVAAANVLMIVALIRLRLVMESYRRRIREYDGRPTTRYNFIIVGCFSILLALAALGSGIASCHPDQWLPKTTQTGKEAR